MQNQAEQLLKLGAKIEALSKKIGSIAKDGRNVHSNYDFISNESMMTALRTELANHQLSILPSVVDYEERDFIVDIPEQQKKKITTRSIVKMEFEIIDLETGFSQVQAFVGAENDSGGKSMQQAITQATKYFFFKLFKVTSKDEVDGDTKTEIASAPAQSSSGTNQDLRPDGKPKAWLNQFEKDKQTQTSEFNSALKRMNDGMTIAQLRDWYKISKAVESALEQIANQ
jgi:hypothetical protein